MSIQHRSCPACGSYDIQEIVRRSSFPAVLFPIEEAKRNSVTTAALVAMGCRKCDHLFLNEIDQTFNQRLYTDYYYLYPYSNLESLETAYRRPFERVFRFAFEDGSGVGKSLLEIGCSSDNQLDLFRAAGFACTGISPGADSLNSQSIIDGFYESHTFSQSFDCIVSRFNLEHIIDLPGFLAKAYRELKVGGLLMIQVPNVQSFLAGGMLAVFAHEHPHYFSRASLSLALERSGFKVELIQADISNPSIIACARRRDDAPHSRNQARQNLAFMDTVLDVMRKEDRASFVFYGAGLSLCALLYLDDRISEFMERMQVVDDNPLLHGRHMPNTRLKVLPLDAITEPQDAILFVLLNSIYHARVMPRVRPLGFKKVFCLTGEGVDPCF